MTRICSLFLLLCIFLAEGCSNRSAVDDAQLNAINDLVIGKKTPDEVLLNNEEIMKHSAAYAEILADHMGLPADVLDLNLLLGQVHYRWGSIDKALLYLQQADRGRRSFHGDVATDYLLFTAGLAGRAEVIEDLREDEKWMLSKETFLELASGNCGALEFFGWRSSRIQQRGKAIQNSRIHRIP